MASLCETCCRSRFEHMRAALHCTRIIQNLAQDAMTEIKRVACWTLLSLQESVSPRRADRANF